MRVVLDMVKGLKGHNVTCDNFFTSYSLGVELRKKNLTLVGTIAPSYHTSQKRTRMLWF
ncbi:hypothetical protein T12_6493 [Trichinella patagoniensis]|uniref:PiggyBac transposable element-derived protein domain-containing protein n=1 Tax=Trichinella patagoniensis TaxID=990121 RepID=A0A0V0YQ47_9BILA|nr:hypothetical protein T12_6493 [Trichinella patagoniensis]